MSFPSDIAAFFVDGVSIAHASGSFRGYLDTADAVSFDGITHGAPVLHYPAGVTLQQGDALTIGARSYTVAQPPRALGDGAQLMVELY